jgi:hypothetical protein
MQAALVVVDEDTRSNVHRRNKAQTLLDAAFAQAFLYLGRDIDECAATRYVEPQLLAIALHRSSFCCKLLRWLVQVSTSQLLWRNVIVSATSFGGKFSLPAAGRGEREGLITDQMAEGNVVFSRLHGNASSGREG